MQTKFLKKQVMRLNTAFYFAANMLNFCTFTDNLIQNYPNEGQSVCYKYVLSDNSLGSETHYLNDFGPGKYQMLRSLSDRLSKMIKDDDLDFSFIDNFLTNNQKNGTLDDILNIFKNTQSPELNASLLNCILQSDLNIFTPSIKKLLKDDSQSRNPYLSSIARQILDLYSSQYERI